MLILTDINEIMIRHLNTQLLGVFKGKPVVGLISTITFRSSVEAGVGKESLTKTQRGLKSGSKTTGK